MTRIREQEVKQKLKEIEDAITVVEENLPSDLDEFLALGLVKDGIYKKVEFAIENVIDICNIINTDLSLGVPADDEDIIKNLEMNKILTNKLIDRIRRMKGFRNILVHKYGKIEDEMAFEMLQNNLADFQEFSEEILKFLTKNKSKSK